MPSYFYNRIDCSEMIGFTIDDDEYSDKKYYIIQNKYLAHHYHIRNPLRIKIIIIDMESKKQYESKILNTNECRNYTRKICDSKDKVHFEEKMNTHKLSDFIDKSFSYSAYSESCFFDKETQNLKFFYDNDRDSDDDNINKRSKVIFELNLKLEEKDLTFPEDVLDVLLKKKEKAIMSKINKNIKNIVNFELKDLENILKEKNQKL
jgi:hypothetical protein